MNKKYFILSIILLFFCIGFTNITSPISCIQEKMGCAGGWKEIGEGSASGDGISDNSTMCGSPSLVINNSGNPVIGWESGDSLGALIHVTQWNGTGWEAIGVNLSAGSSGVNLHPSLRINKSGNPVIAWDGENSENYEIYLKQWNGSTWEQLGGSASDGGIGNGQYPSLTINNSGNPVVAWYNENTNIYLKQWNDSSWEELGGSASNGGIGNGYFYGISLAINSLGYPIVVWGTGSEIYLKQWNGSNWEGLGGSSSGGGIGSGYTDTESLAINNAGYPVVAWINSTSEGKRIYLKQWNGTTWEELGGSASDKGVSGSIGEIVGISLDINDVGNPVVVWGYNINSYNREIYLKQWNGNEWEELDNSASEGGISNSSGLSMSPSIAINSSGNPVVAWSEESDLYSSIYIKQYVP